jgi:hypothetical protein
LVTFWLISSRIIQNQNSLLKSDTVWTENWIKLPNLCKKWPKNTKMSTSKLNLKALNINIKLVLKSLNTYNKPFVETSCWWKFVKYKVAEMAKFCPIWSHWSDYLSIIFLIDSKKPILRIETVLDPKTVSFQWEGKFFLAPFRGMRMDQQFIISCFKKVSKILILSWTREKKHFKF